MRTPFQVLFLTALILHSTSCKRHMTPAEVKASLETSMTDYLRAERPGSTALQFQIVDVDYFETADNYLCEFKVKLKRPDGTDTTGMIKGRISKDFSIVTKK